MARYRRSSYGRRRRSTNVIRMKFQSFMDISTSDSSMQIITISAGGPEILKRLAPQFAAYKYYKIGNISVKLVPASTLPVDPTGLSYEVGENPTVDPRDQLTPGMMRITNGEDIFEDITGVSSDIQHEIYNNMLLDPRWFKWMLQSGVKRHATPRYWQIGQLHQDKWPGSTINYPMIASNGSIVGTGCQQVQGNASAGSSSDPASFNGPYVQPHSDPRGFFQVGHRGVLGWLPTDGLVKPLMSDTPDALLASPVEVECMKIILPKCYKTRYFYRAFITETIYFREPIVNFGIENASGYYHRPLDVFHYPGYPTPALPTDGVGGTYPFPQDGYTGGNYGDD